MSVTLKWKSRFNATSYRIYRSETMLDTSALPPPIATITGNQFQFIDETVAENTEYFYVLAAVLDGTPEQVAFARQIVVASQEGVDDGGGGPVVGVVWSAYYDEVMAATAGINGAWGLRRLVSDYNASLVRVRDTDDDSEFDVGIGSNGFLDDFTVVGEARVVRVYDQSGNGNDIGQTDPARQPLLRTTQSFAGLPEIKFNGSTEYLVDLSFSTTKEYMTAQPFLAFEGSGQDVAQSFACVAGIAHNPGSHSSPFFRLGIICSSTSQNMQMTTQDGGAAGRFTFNRLRSTGLIMAHTGADVLVGNRASETIGGPSAPGVTITYPNATGLFVGCHGNVGEFWGGTMNSVVIGQDSAATQSNVEAYALAVLNADQTPPAGNKVLDVDFSGAVDSIEAADTALGHPVWITKGARLLGPENGLELDGTGRAVIGASNTLQPAGDFTIIVDVKWDVIASDRIIMSSIQRAGPNSGWRLASRFGDGSNISFVFNNTSGGGNYLETTGAGMVVGNWYEVRIVKIGTNDQIYIDGVSRASLDRPDIFNINGPIFIGEDLINGTPMQGAIRNLQIFDGLGVPP